MTSRAYLRVAAAGILLLIAAASTYAHHGWGGYDSNTTLNLTGIIRESTYEHPHGTVKLAVGNKTWEIVLAPPSRMQVRGLSREMLATGTKVTLSAIRIGTIPTRCGQSAKDWVFAQWAGVRLHVHR